MVAPVETAVARVERWLVSCVLGAIVATGCKPTVSRSDTKSNTSSGPSAAGLGGLAENSEARRLPPMQQRVPPKASGASRAFDVVLLTVEKLPPYSQWRTSLPELQSLTSDWVVFTNGRSPSEKASRALASVLSGRFATELAGPGIYSRPPFVRPEFAFAADAPWLTRSMPDYGIASVAAEGDIRAKGHIPFSEWIPSKGLGALDVEEVEQRYCSGRTLDTPLFLWLHLARATSENVPQLRRLLSCLEEQPWWSRAAAILAATGGVVRWSYRPDDAKRVQEKLRRRFGAAPYKHGSRSWGATTPILIRVPGTKGKHLPQLVSLVDLNPTIAELLGMPAPAGSRGNSLVNLLYGEEERWEQRPVLFDIVPNVRGAEVPGLRLLEEHHRGDLILKLIDTEIDPDGWFALSAGRLPFEMQPEVARLRALAERVDLPAPPAGP